MKAKITIRTKNLAIQDLTAVLSSTQQQQKVALSKAKSLANDISFIQFENIQENDMSAVLSILSELRYVVREAEIRFVNVILSESFKSEFISCLLNDAVGFQTIVGSNHNQEIEILKALLIDLSNKSLTYLIKKTAGATIRIGGDNRSYSQQITPYEITLVDSKLWILVKDELAALLSKRKANEKVIINFTNWHLSQQDGLLQWLEMVHFEAELEVINKGNRILYNEIQHLRNRNLCIEFPQNGLVRIGPKLQTYGAQPTELKISERDAGFIQSKLAMMPELRSITFQRCASVPLAWEVLLNAASAVQSLESLSFVGVQLDEACVSPFIEILPRLSALKELTFDNVDMPDDAKNRMVSSISKLPKLSAFGMANMRIVEGVISAIASATSITKLDFRGAEISDEATVEFEFAQDFSENVEIILFQSKLKAEKLIQILFRSDKFPVANFLYFDSDNKYSYVYRERDHVEKDQALLDTFRNRNRLIRKLISSEEVISEISFSDMIFSGVCIKPLQLYMQRCPHVVELDLSGSQLSDEKFTDLAMMLGNFGSLRKIDFSRSGKPLAPAILANLIFSLPDLSELRLIGSETDHNELFSLLLSSDKFPTCSVIFYEGREGVDKAIIQNQTRFEQLRKRNLLVQSLQNSMAAEYENTGLPELDFNYFYFTDHCLPVIFSYMERHKSVKRLSILNNELTETGIQTVCENLPHHMSLQRFEISRSQYSAATFKLLVDSIIKSAHIRQVSFGTMNLPVLEATRCLEGANLEKLDGSVVDSGIYNWYRDDVNLCITEVCTRSFETDQRFKKVRHRNVLLRRFLNEDVNDTNLDLNESAISSPIIPVVCGVLARNKQIRVLNISGNEFDDNGMEKLIEAVSKHPNIRKLVLSKNKMTEKSATRLAEYLKVTPLLHELGLEDMAIPASGIVQLALALRTNISLLSLNVSYNEEAVKALQQFGAALRFNQSLKRFYCLDRHYPQPFDVFITAKQFRNGAEGCDNYQTYESRRTQYKAKIEEARISVDSFCKQLRNPKSAKGKKPQGVNNNTLLVCDLFGDDLYSRVLSKQAAVKLSPCTTILNENRLWVLNIVRDLKNFIASQDKKQRAAFKANWEKNIRRTVSLYLTSEDDDTLLHLAAAGDKDAIALLLPEGSQYVDGIYGGIDMGILNAKGQSVIDVATANKDPEVLKKIMFSEVTSSPANTLTKLNDGEEPPVKMLKVDPEAVVEVTPKNQEVIEVANASAGEGEASAPNAQQGKWEITPVSIAFPGSDVVQISTLIYSENLIALGFCFEQNPAFIQCRIQGQTLLHIAIGANKRKAAQFLVEKGIDLNALNSTHLSPLFYLLNQKSFENMYDLLTMVKLLIDHGANMRLSDEHALHVAVKRSLFRVVKFFISQGADVNCTNQDKHTALTLAALLTNTQILELLLTVPELLRKTVQDAKDYVSKYSLASVVDALLSRRLQMDFLEPKANIHWLKNMAICLGASSPEKTVVVPSEPLQHRLMLQNKFISSKLRQKKRAKTDVEEGGDNMDLGEDEDENELVQEENGNPVTACFTFIVSTSRHLSEGRSSREAISILLDLNLEHHLTQGDGEEEYGTEDVRRAVQRRAQIGEQICKKDPEDRQHTSPEEINVGSELAKRSFEALFHHGEQSLASALEQKFVLQEIMKRLLAHPRFINGSKVYGIVLDLHSPRYVCSNCEITLLSIQHPTKSLFLTNLKNLLQERGYLLPRFSPFRMVTRIGSVMAFERATVTADKHWEVCLDMRTLGNKAILQQDLIVTAGDNLQYNSRVK